MIIIVSYCDDGVERVYQVTVMFFNVINNLAQMSNPIWIAYSPFFFWDSTCNDIKRTCNEFPLFPIVKFDSILFAKIADDAFF